MKEMDMLIIYMFILLMTLGKNMIELNILK
jgi:hypothetical protein